MSRTADHPIHPLLLNRHSGRAMNGEALSADALKQLLEAARWAPSCANRQPWRIVYAHNATPAFDAIFATLAEGNQLWCRRAAVLLAICSSSVADGQPNGPHTFDTGAAWMAIALQASTMGLVCHAMAGVNYEACGAAIALPSDHTLHCVVALGHPGDINDLPDFLQAREIPNGRNKTETFSLEGSFAKSS
ncbi:MAG: nitroreductase family protein [Deltaproteobacteria bacterium]|nr:nitroreductase family protein [Deltaproteobacteria bacterium]